MKFVMKRRRNIIRRRRGKRGHDRVDRMDYHDGLPNAFDGFTNRLEDPFGIGVDNYLVKPPTLPRQLFREWKKPPDGFPDRLEDPFVIGVDNYLVKPPIPPRQLFRIWKKSPKNITRRRPGNRGDDCGGRMDYHDGLPNAFDGCTNRLEDPFGFGVDNYLVKPPTPPPHMFGEWKKPPDGFPNSLEDPFSIGVDNYLFRIWKKPPKNITRRRPGNRGDECGGRMDYHDGLPNALDGFTNRLEDPFGIGVDNYLVKPPTPPPQLFGVWKKPPDGFPNRLEDPFGIGVDNYLVKPPTPPWQLVMEEDHYEKDSPAGSKSRRVALALDALATYACYIYETKCKWQKEFC